MSYRQASDHVPIIYCTSPIAYTSHGTGGRTTTPFWKELAMSSHPLRRCVFIILAGFVFTPSFFGARPARALPWFNRISFASPRFQQIWGSADDDVANGRAARSWTWGPSPWFDY